MISNLRTVIYSQNAHKESIKDEIFSPHANKMQTIKWEREKSKDRDYETGRELI